MAVLYPQRETNDSIGWLYPIAADRGRLPRRTSSCHAHSDPRREKANRLGDCGASRQDQPWRGLDANSNLPATWDPFELLLRGSGPEDAAEFSVWLGS